MTPYRKPRTIMFGAGATAGANAAAPSRTANPVFASLTSETATMEHPVMSYAANTSTKNTAGWVTFSYVSFAVSAGMMALGIWALPADLWVKGYLLMASVFMLGSTFTLAKTVRDEHEAKRFANRIEDAKAERLLMEVGR